MGFDRFNLYKKIADTYKGEELDTNTLAWKCRESAPKKWMVVNPNNVKVYRGEQRKEFIDGTTGKRVLMMYRCTHDFDETLFCMLMLRMQGYILHHWKSVYKYFDVDEFLDQMEEAIFQTLVRYDIDKGRFETLANTMLSNFKVNLIEKHVPSERVRNAKTGKIEKKFHYDQMVLSLEEINENPKCRFYQSLPSVSMFSNGDGTISALKKEYKLKQDLLTWLILDFQENQPEIGNYQLLNKDLKLKKFTSTRILELYNKIQNDEKLCNELGFPIKNNDNRSFKLKYKESICKLRKDVQKYALM
ncbi:hypothetical protein [uncultured Clostridium sp.]|uniref:hypothetical protein n=1 Tax=uncultured Clostridium sp. TaxID=59620 RepID=UPI0026033FB3|nr:hypothetical protein [uncultured Clostridium sp.]